MRGRRKGFLDKLILQGMICLVLFGGIYMTEKMSFPAAEEVIEVFRIELEKDYSVKEIVDSTVTLGKAVLEKPVAVYGRILEQSSTEDFILPTDELTVTVFNGGIGSSDLSQGVSVASGSGIESSKGTGNFLEFFSNQEILVYCAKGGVVSEVVEEADGTYSISIQHDHAITTQYLGCTTVYTEPLSRVKQGDLIASVNQGGSNRLTFEIWEKGERIDPGKYLKTGQGQEV